MRGRDMRWDIGVSAMGLFPTRYLHDVLMFGCLRMWCGQRGYRCRWWCMMRRESDFGRTLLVDACRAAGRLALRGLATASNAHLLRIPRTGPNLFALPTGRRFHQPLIPGLQPTTLADM
ncbi:hypothetical protein GUJ93_ZPchr0002g26761 [Zizania palustris]|uniref:Uncharacterized protein n=1 Tax=Zizania palustris TaxID=103762 RepID=A0A8J5SF76_ZIZPA|nr:hypothetical protein GUJ93_ZPchr0002g26761 [Zizania palustris]